MSKDRSRADRAKRHRRILNQHGALRARRMWLEALEPRQMMAALPPGSVPSLDDFPGNYYPPQYSQAAQIDFLSAAKAGDTLTVGLDYFRTHLGPYGLQTADLTHYKVTDNYASGGIKHLYLQQTYNGLPVADAVANVNLMSDGRVLTAAANFVRNLSYPANTPPNPEITAEEAVSIFAAAAGLPISGALQPTSSNIGTSLKTTFVNGGLASGPITAQLQYVANSAGGVELAWEIIAKTPDRSHWYDLAIAAEGARQGEVIRLSDWVEHATYDVIPRPFQDPLQSTTLQTVINPQDPTASPFGWHDTDFIPGAEFSTTQGNNVNVHPDPGIFLNQTNGGPTLDFNFAFNPAGAPLFNFNAASTNMFYWVNLAHDISYHHGFDEPSGNFQVTNRTGLGIGGDAVDAIPQSLSPFAQNNAFMATPPEGMSPDMEFGLFASTVPFRDTDMDGTVVLHEFTHGISNRLTGGPTNANALQSLQSGGMGEGWSDWFALVNTIKVGDTPNTPRGLGQWILNQPANGVGIRRQFYSFDMTVDPLTLGDFNGDTFPRQNNSEEHNAGEIWASALWDMTWNLINRYGFTQDVYNGNGGNTLAVKLVLEAMKLQPSNPTFLEARNAILSADLALTGGRNYELIWETFARRGFGQSAFDANSNALSLFERFDKPGSPARISGNVFNDSNGNAKRDPNELPLANWTVYVDTNNNGQLDAGERSQLTFPDGSYSFAFTTNQNVIVREVLKPNFKQTLPVNNAARQASVVVSQNKTGQDFGVQGLPGEVDGFKFGDFDGDGVFDPQERGLAGVIIFVDLNNDGRLNALEPAATTDVLGNYKILNVPAGTYNVLEAPQAGLIQTFPGLIPGTTDRFGHGNVVVQSGQKTTGINFGNKTVLDFGDAPDTYGTTLATNGPRHGILAGFHLGPTEPDAEKNGRPTPDAFGDDSDGSDDEDGIQFLTGIVPGQNATIRVTASSGGNPAGKLQGWIDFNHNNRFDDPSEHIISNQILVDGAQDISFFVPAGLTLGPTFARFRYGYEQNLGPLGAAGAGEVEDYAVNLLANVPVATPDVFPRPGEPLIKQGTIDNVLDVLLNDFGTTFGPPHIVPGSFPSDLADGSHLELNSTGDRILFTPGADTFGAVTFTYTVSDGHSESAPGLVTVNVTIRDPRSLDDTATILFAAVPVTTNIPVMANDLFPFADTQIVGAPVKLTPGIVGDTMVVAPGGKSVNFTAPVGFKGTIIYEYTIDDSDGTTAASTSRITVQVVDVPSTTDQLRQDGYLAQLSVDILNANGTQSITTIEEGQNFLVRVRSLDLRPPFHTSATTNVQFVPTPTTTTFAGNASALPPIDDAYIGFSIQFTTGALAGQTSVVTDYSSADGVFTVATPFSAPPTAGDEFIIISPSFANDPIVGSSVQAAPAATDTQFAGDATLSSNDDFFDNDILLFVSGTLNGQHAKITDYDGTTKLFTFAAGSFTGAPAATDQFIILTPPDVGRGVEAAYLDLIWNLINGGADPNHPGRNYVEPVLSAVNPLGMQITFNPVYNLQQDGTPNSPAPGEINDVGGTHFDPAPGAPGVGPNVVRVFDVLMRAKLATPAGQPLVIAGDPADAVPQHDILLAPDDKSTSIELVQLTDEQVFLRESAALTITPPGGEFTNFSNPLDVNNDKVVAPLDALLVINEVNGNGSHGLGSTSGFIASSTSVGKVYPDVNHDSYISPLDALLVINYLNVPRANSAPPAGAGGEGEGADSVTASSEELVQSMAALPDDAPAKTSYADQSDDSALELVTTAVTSGASVLPPVYASSMASQTQSVSTESSETSADAADEFFAQLALSLSSSARRR
jgi:hypothetical protein